MSEWQPIETAPRDETTILVCGFGYSGYYVDVAEYRHGRFKLFDPRVEDYVYESDGYTHWQPLPAPPDMEV